MSKRGTENQLTKDDYERGDDDDSTSIFGTFKKASNDELAKRPYVESTSSDQSDDGIKKASVFASGGPLLSPTFSQPSLDTATKPANPFANVTFGMPAANTPTFSTTPTLSTTTTTATTVASKPSAETTSIFASPALGAFGQSTKQSESGVSTSNFSSGFGNGLGNVSSTAPGFSNNAFTFNVGSNAKPLDISDKESSGGSSGGAKDWESLQRTLRGINHSFLKKIEKEMEHNPTVNLAQIFQQYADHRMKIRKNFRGIDEPRAIVLSDTKEVDSNASSPGGARGSNRISRMGSGSSDSPKMSFGLPVDIAANAANSTSANKRPLGGFGFGAAANSDNSSSVYGSAASLAAPSLATTAMPASGPTASPSGFSGVGGTASMFGFGSSSMKGAIDPPKNPTSLSWNFSAPASNTASSGSINSSSSVAPPLAQSSSSISTSTIATPKPFSFNPPKPFSFLPPTSATTAGEGPKPFAFQVPPVMTTPSTSAPSSLDATVGQDDSEKMPDDTKSQLVDSREGEEDEKTVFEVRAKLYAVVDNEYKDLGVGKFRVNENSETMKRRMIMRTEGTGLLTLNSWVIQGMPAKRQKNMVTLFSVEEGKPKKFMLRVKEEQAAEEVVQALEAGQDK
ncbi:hypothetical protein BGX27_004285 [Mortierella sp. AM989]|nr:hypothetical protein BGX27_004285 [Mortierella sp. AM989]